MDRFLEETGWPTTRHYCKTTTLFDAKNAPASIRAKYTPRATRSPDSFLPFQIAWCVPASRTPSARRRLHACHVHVDHCDKEMAEASLAVGLAAQGPLS